MMVARDYRAIGRGALQGNWGTAVLVGLVAMLLGGAASDGNITYNSATSASLNNTDFGSLYYMPPSFYLFLTFFGTIISIWIIVSIIFGGAVNLGYNQFNIDLVKKDRPINSSTLFSKFSYFVKAFLLQLVIGLFVFLWTLLLIIPGIVAAYSYSMAGYLMAQNPELGVMEAIKLSKQMMHGNRWRLFCLDFSFIGWYLLACITLGIGFLFLQPYVAASRAAFYLDLTRQLPGMPGYNYPAQGYPQNPPQPDPNMYQNYASPQQGFAPYPQGYAPQQPYPQQGQPQGYPQQVQPPVAPQPNVQPPPQNNGQ